MTKPTVDQARYIDDALDRMNGALEDDNLPVLAAEAADLVDYISNILAPPDPYADQALRPGLNAVGGERIIQGLKEAIAQTKSSGDPTFDPTIPKDAV